MPFSTYIDLGGPNIIYGLTDLAVTPDRIRVVRSEDWVALP